MDFNCALVTGGGGGIGKALSKYFISKGKKVIIAGRTESNIQATAKEIGAAGYYLLDTGSTSDIPSFVERITSEHPELDCLVNNAGVQRPLQIQEQSGDEFLSKADQEIDINVRGPMHLAVRLLPHLRSKPRALIINVSSVLGYVPFLVINPVYNGTKAWLHFWSMNLRSQLRDTGVRVVEIAPPMVESDLHREHTDPDDNKKKNNPMALTMEEFMDETARKLENGDETISAGIGGDLVKRWFDTFGDMYVNMYKD